MGMNSLPSERVAVGGVIDPDVTVASTVDSEYLDMSKFHSAMAVGICGTLGASATVDFSIIQATASDGTGAKAITGKAATQMTQAGTDQSDTYAVINLMAQELDLANGFDFVALRCTVAAATSDVSGILLGLDPRNAPASDNDATGVGEIIS